MQITIDTTQPISDIDRAALLALLEVNAPMTDPPGSLKTETTRTS